MLTRKTKLLLSLTAAVPLMFAACTDNGIFNPLDDAAGTYQITVYKGALVPHTYTVQPGDPVWNSVMPNGGHYSIDDGTLILRSDGTFTERNNYTVTPSGGSSQPSYFVSEGSWNVSGTQLQLYSAAEGRNVTGVLDFDTINYQELDEDGVLQSYEYQR
jgi:hypothetical protein